MPRDSLGQHSLPTGTLVNTGDTVLVSQHNPFAQDVSQSLSNSLDRDGKGGMRADLPMGGHRVVNMADGTDDTDAATVGQLNSLTFSGAVPIGAVVDYFGATPPTGFLFPVGQAISRTTYAELFALIGTTQGAGDGSTTFNLPDYRGRVGAGKDDMGGTAAGRLTSAGSGVAGATLGAVGGAQTHTLTTAQLPAHTHSTLSVSTVALSTGAVPLALPTGTTGETGSAGSGQAHNNVQPTIVCNKIMRVI